jgi:hypothetical protein
MRPSWSVGSKGERERGEIGVIVMMSDGKVDEEDV